MQHTCESASIAFLRLWIGETTSGAEQPPPLIDLASQSSGIDRISTSQLRFGDQVAESSLSLWLSDSCNTQHTTILLLLRRKYCWGL